MNQIDCIAPLLEAGADPRKAASDGEDAVLLATSQARKEIVALFESWDPSKADAINAEFDRKVAEQQRVDELREQVRQLLVCLARPLGRRVALRVEPLLQQRGVPGARPAARGRRCEGRSYLW